MTLTAPALWAPVVAAAAMAAAWWAFVMRRTVASVVRTEGSMFDRSPRRSGFRHLLPWALVASGAVAVGSLTGRMPFALAFAAMGYGVVVLSRALARQRHAMREEQFAIDAIQTASRSLKAGVPLSGVLELLALEAQGRTGRAFREIVQREGMGEELGHAVRKVLIRSPLPALQGFGLAVIMQVSAGGNLADTTDRLAESLIERRRVRRRARAIVAYSRTASSVLAVLPLVAVPLMCGMVDGYAEFLFHEPQGNVVLAVAVVLLAVGLTSVQRLGRIEPVPDWSDA
jgi:tight adherence protein B